MSWSDDCWTWSEEYAGVNCCGPCSKFLRICCSEQHSPDGDLCDECIHYAVKHLNARVHHGEYCDCGCKLPPRRRAAHRRHKRRAERAAAKAAQRAADEEAVQAMKYRAPWRYRTVTNPWPVPRIS